MGCVLVTSAESNENGTRVRRDLEKFYAAPERIDFTPRAVGGVYILQASQDGTSAELIRLNPAESLAELTKNAYRPALVGAMNMLSTYFQVSIAIQRSAGVYCLARPLDFARADEAVGALERHWRETAGMLTA